MEPNGDPPPFWSPPASSTLHRRRSSSPPIVSLPVLIILLPILALIFLFFAIRPLISLTSGVFRPSSVKKSWDSFNVFLVLFAIICGIFARRNDDASTGSDAGDNRVSRARTADVHVHVDAAGKGNGDSEFSQQWLEFTERRFADPMGRTPGMGMNRLRRNSSYPDLRQESLWETHNDRAQFRFFDDFEINKHRLHSRSFDFRTRGSDLEDSSEIKVIPVDSFVANSSTAIGRLKSPTPPPPPPPPPLPVNQRKSKRTYQTIQKKEREFDVGNTEFAKAQTPPPPPPLPPRPVIPPSPVRVKLEERFGKGERKKTNVKREIKMALASLYRKRKKKQNKNIYENVHSYPSEQRAPPPPPPSPPPPPPSVFRGLFKKANKNKRVHNESAPPPPPPPPPISLPSRSSNIKIQIPPAPSPSPPPPQSTVRRSSTFQSKSRPPLPTTVHNPKEDINSEGQSLMKNIPPAPPPPPPPPFKMTEQKLGVRREHDGPWNTDISQSNSMPTKEELDTANEVHGEGGVGSVFCPSPDVNVKAANFIARLRDEWRLEKMNSVRRLGLGPTSTSEGPNA